jgi:hypothetical protein
MADRQAPARVSAPQLIAALLIGFVCIPAEGAISLVAHAAGTGGHTNGDTTSAVNTAGASLLVAAVGGSGSGTFTVSDTYNNVWIPLSSPGADAVNGIVRIYYVVNPAVGSGHQVSVTGSGIFATIAMQAFSGVAVVSTLETQSGAATGSSTTFQAGSVTPLAAGDIVVAAIEQGSATSVTMSGATVTDQIATVGGLSYGVAMAYLLAPSSSPQNPTWTTNITTVASRSTGIFAQAPAGGPRVTAQGFSF